MIEYRFYNAPDTHTSEVADITFHEQRFEQMLGSLVISDNGPDRLLDVQVSPSSRVQAAKERRQLHIARSERLAGKLRKVGLGPPKIDIPQTSELLLEAHRALKREDDCITVLLDNNDNEYNNQALAVQTYIWAAHANNLPSSQRWRNRLIKSQTIVPELGGVAAGFGLSEIPVANNWYYGIVGGLGTAVGMHKLLYSFFKSGDADFDRALEFARDYTSQNEPIIETHGPPYIPGETSEGDI